MKLIVKRLSPCDLRLLTIPSNTPLTLDWAALFPKTHAGSRLRKAGLELAHFRG